MPGATGRAPSLVAPPGQPITGPVTVDAVAGRVLALAFVDAPATLTRRRHVDYCRVTAQACRRAV